MSLLVLAAIASFGFAAANINNQKTAVNEVSMELEFSAFTSAVCWNKADFVHCKDEIFINCSGKISKADDAAECNGLRFDFPKATGFAVFEKDWKDPRNRIKDLLSNELQ